MSNSTFKQLIAESPSPNTHRVNWSWVQKMQLPENILHFLWPTFQGSLPTNICRVYRHLSVNDLCCRCTSQQETTCHLLRDCPNSTMVWKHLKLDSHTLFYTTNVYDWLVSNLNNDNGIMFATGCQMLWKAQNAKIFQDNSWHIWRIISQIQILHQYINCSNRRAITYKQQREVLWKRPPPTAIKINTNGSSLGNPGKVGYGGLFRDHLRNWISWILRKLWDINEFESIIVCYISWTPNSME